MLSAILPLASHYLTASVLTLVLPTGVLAAVGIWHTLAWIRHRPDR
jgi:hypothetical protein